MGSTTVLTRASSRGNSLRTTVPVDIVRQFNLAEGDKLSWEIRAHNNELVIFVRPTGVRERA
jgi:antitoxin component of MazEF toxin-antitoxin module